MIKVLIPSNAEWDEGNSFGNTFSNLFSGTPDLILANVYCRAALPKTETCHEFFQITEAMLLRNSLNSRVPAGRALTKEARNMPIAVSKRSMRIKTCIMSFVKRRRWIIFFWVRDIIWLIGQWRSRDLEQFVRSFQPDVIFLPMYQELVYINKMALWLKRRLNVPIVAYASDDVYTLRQFSLSPLFWLDYLAKRRWVKRAVQASKLFYVVSDRQKEDYERVFGVNCKILFKGGDFSGPAPGCHVVAHPRRLIYTGNLTARRLTTLLAIGRALRCIKATGGTPGVLHIYTTTRLSRREERQVIAVGTIHIHEAVNPTSLPSIQRNADILVHVESFKLKERLRVRHSFSTKIVDYFQAGRCILAVGWRHAASIDYLARHDAAIIATSAKQIEERLRMLLDSPETIVAYDAKSWECGQRNHQIGRIRKELAADLIRISGRGKFAESSM